MKFNFKFKFRNPFKSPVGLTKLQKRLFRKPKLTWRSAGKYALWSLAGFVLLIVFLFAWYSKDLPTPGKLKNLVSASSTRLFDRNMNPLYTISGEKKRIIIDKSEIPEVVKNATIAVEDRGFYNHAGIDPKAVARSIFVDTITRKKSQGGSTITQQLIKNTVLNNEKSYTRKIKEAILSIEIEAIYSKEDILAMYLNQIPYGGNNYGIEAASKTYFSKSAKDLTLAEAATLAALPQAPSTYSPYGQHTDQLIWRRNYCLDSMADLGYITRAQADEAKKVELAVSPQKDSITAPHFVLFVKEWLVDYYTNELGDKQLAENKVEEGGLTVITTLDLPKQKIAEEVLSGSEAKLKAYDASNAGLVSIDPKKGEILAMVGSIDYFKAGFGNFNVTTALRQPGSSFKPLVYATGFKEKYNPGYILYDVKTDFGGNYIPVNYNGRYNGPVSIRKALGNSYNIPAVKMLGMVGIDKALQTASDLGITTLTDKDRYGLSLVLGGGEVKLAELTAAYGAFANGGTYMPTTPILEIKDNKGKTIYDHKEPKDGKVVLDPQAAYEITSILSDQEAKKPTFSGLMRNLTLDKRPVASKTGTTNGYRDAWTIGYTPSLVTGVWAGNNDNTPMNAAGGAIAAGPLWHDYMIRALENTPNEEFARPAGIQEVAVDKWSNKLPSDGSEVIKDIFASWQVPKDKDDFHFKVRVCRENGLLADAGISDALAEDRVFINIHSEKPEMPNWEGPVIAWAKANNLYNPPPTQKCSATEAQPSLSITSPSNGESVSGTFSITVSANAATGARSVEYYIDNVGIGSVTSSPYSTSYNSSQLSNGDHTLKAVMTTNSGSTVSSQLTFSVGNDTTAPDIVTGATMTSRNSNSITLGWTNPGNSDFTKVEISVYKGSTYITTVEENGAPSASDSNKINGLTSGTTYKFILKSVDSNGNKSVGVEVNAATT